MSKQVRKYRRNVKSSKAAELELLREQAQKEMSKTAQGVQPAFVVNPYIVYTYDFFGNTIDRKKNSRYIWWKGEIS